MKNLLLTLFTVLLASANFAQHNLETRLLNPTPGSTVQSTSFEITSTIKNVGTTSLAIGDTIVYAMVINGTSYAYSSTQYTGNIRVLTAIFAPGDSFNVTSVRISPTNPPTSATVWPVCAATYMLGGLTDTDTTNNLSCYNWQVSTLGVDELSINEEVNISAIYGVLKMTSTNQENHSYSVYSMAGQVVSQGSFVNNKEVDMTGAAKGIYAVVVSNGTEKITKKIAIQ